MTTSLSQRLKSETAAQHERMHTLMARADPFASRDAFAGFVAVQLQMQRDVEHLFGQPGVREAVPDLDTRGREAACVADLADLNAPVPAVQLGSTAVRMPQALGWLYVSEGSTLGAAFLLKEAKDKLGLSDTFGARNLAAYPEGRGKAWKRFVEALDAPALQGQHDAVIAGANAAFDRFGELLERHFALAPQAA